MLIYAPLEHLDIRYTTHLDRDILNYLNKKQEQTNREYIYLSPLTLSKGISNGSFLDSNNTVYRQFTQINQLIDYLIKGIIPKQSTLFVTDIWNFGLLSIPYLNFFGNYDIRVKGVLHAGSFTDTDFVRRLERYYKGFEDILFDITDEIFVGSQFIKNDIVEKRIVREDKIKVTGLPLDEKGLAETKRLEKENLIVFNGRNVDEKQPYLFDLLSQNLPDYEYVNTHKHNLSKRDYYHLLSRAKVVVSYALQENFGYGIMEAVRLGCIPVLPNRLVYPEFYPKEYLYSTFEQSVELVYHAMNDNLKVPTLDSIPSQQKIFDTWFHDY